MRVWEIQLGGDGWNREIRVHMKREEKLPWVVESDSTEREEKLPFTLRDSRPSFHHHLPTELGFRHGGETEPLRSSRIRRLASRWSHGTPTTQLRQLLSSEILPYTRESDWIS